MPVQRRRHMRIASVAACPFRPVGRGFRFESDWKRVEERHGAGGICGLLRLLPVRFVLSGAVSAPSQAGSGWKSGTAPGGICGFCGRPIAVRPALRMRNRRDFPRGPACRRVVSFAAAYSAAAASASSTRIRPQYSQTMIFLLWRISICRWGGMRLKQPPQASRLTVTTASPLRTLRRIRS